MASVNIQSSMPASQGLPSVIEVAKLPPEARARGNVTVSSAVPKIPGMTIRNPARIEDVGSEKLKLQGELWFGRDQHGNTVFWLKGTDTNWILRNENDKLITNKLEAEIRARELIENGAASHGSLRTLQTPNLTDNSNQKILRIGGTQVNNVRKIAEIKGQNPEGKSVYGLLKTGQAAGTGKNILWLEGKDTNYILKANSVEEAKSEAVLLIEHGGARKLRNLNNPVKVVTHGDVVVELPNRRKRVAGLQEIKEHGGKTISFRVLGVTDYNATPIIPAQERKPPEPHGYFFGSAPGKTQLVTDPNGKIITDSTAARRRVEEMLLLDGLTTRTHANPKEIQVRRQRISEERSRLPGLDRATVIKAPDLVYSVDQNRPNRLLQSGLQPKTVERGGWNVKWETTTNNGSPTFSAMIVPNIVGEIGPKKAAGKNPTWGGITPQPFTGFFPISGGFPGYQATSQNQAVYRQTLHPAGFYPADPNWERWNKELRQHPERTPEFMDGKWGYSSQITTENWYQIYANTPNLLTPLLGGSLNARAIKWRYEQRAGLYTQNDTVLGRHNSQMLLTPYSWGQIHIKTGVGNVALPNRAGYITAGGQGEVGIYVYQTSTPLSNPWGRVNLEDTKPKDWRIVNGEITDAPKKLAAQFSDIKEKTGLVFLSESVIPDWGDRSAYVFMQTPHQLSVSDLAKQINEIGIKFQPRYKEFKFITEADLIRLNPRLSKDKPIPVGTWINTGAMVAVGGPGLFLPKDVGR
jgi:hypothetical protein